MKRKVNFKVLILSLVIVYSVALIGSLFTSPVTKTDWYDSIRPSITPPSIVFPIVWNILFLLIALSLYVIITSKKNEKFKKKAYIIFGVNFFLNILWSVLFFGLKNPFLAFFEIILLWISILVMIIYSYKINKNSSYLLVPYILWVSFAIVLNALSAF
jgi:tryptophan-rich sensory protein